MKNSPLRIRLASRFETWVLHLLGSQCSIVYASWDTETGGMTRITTFQRTRARTGVLMAFWQAVGNDASSKFTDVEIFELEAEINDV